MSWVQNRSGRECLSTALHDIDTCTVGGRSGICTKQLFSRYYFTGMNSAMHDIPNDSWILGIGYSVGDMQITVTGSCMKGETVQEGAMRELEEELGIYFDQSQLRLHSNGQMEKKKGKSTIFLLCIDNCAMRPVLKLNHRSGKDDKSKKISIMIYGSRNNLKNLMEMARPMKRSEGIVYYGSVPHGHASLIVKIMKEIFLDNSLLKEIEEEIEEKEKVVIKKRPQIIIQIQRNKKARYFQEEEI